MPADLGDECILVVCARLVSAQPWQPQFGQYGADVLCLNSMEPAERPVKACSARLCSRLVYGRPATSLAIIAKYSATTAATSTGSQSVPAARVWVSGRVGTAHFVATIASEIEKLSEGRLPRRRTLRAVIRTSRHRAPA